MGYGDVPIGGGFVVLALGVLVTGVAAALQVRSPTIRLSETAGQFGMVGVIAAIVTASVVGYRGATHRPQLILALTPVVVLVGGLWSWLTFVAADSGPALHEAVVGLTAPFAVVLLVRGLRINRRLEVFTGLGFTAILLAAAVARTAPATAVDSPVLAFLAALGAAVVLYGALIDLRLAERRSMDELLESRRLIEEEVARAEGILHDLRSGLLAIEAAIGSVDGELAQPLRAEAARLRRLTVRDERCVAPFDLVDGVADLIATRRAAGLSIEFCAPPSAPIVAERTEVLSIVDNLLANAVRHGGGTSVMVEIGHPADSTVVTVSNGGPAIDMEPPEAIFDHRTTTHPAGKGLGLNRSRMLAELNHARLDLGRSDARRTAFTLSFPTAVAARPEPAPEPTPEPTPAPSPPPAVVSTGGVRP